MDPPISGDRAGGMVKERDVVCHRLDGLSMLVGMLQDLVACDDATFDFTKGGPRSNSGGTSFWMKSKVASSHATRSWSIPTSMDRPSRRWHTTSRSLTIPPARSPEIGGSIHLKRRPSLRKQASSGWPFQPQASSRRNATHWNTHAPGGAGIAGALASRGESPASDVTMDGACAAITGRTGWNGGSV